VNRADLTDELLRRVPILQRMHDSERRQLAELGTLVEFRAGDLVIEQGRSRQSLWILLDGRCEVFREPEKGQPGGRVRLATLEPYSTFGEMSFFHPADHSASVRAETPCTVLRIERGDFNELVEEGASAASKLACNAIEVLAGRLRRMDQWIATLHRESDDASGPDGARAAQAAARKANDWAEFRDRLLSGWNL
jgi:CRP/FNR family transcriptional regulator, cyclic AMP receptor protein